MYLGPGCYILLALRNEIGVNPVVVGVVSVNGNTKDQASKIHSREYGFSMNKNVSQGNLEIQVPLKDGVNVPASF